ncbi:hypothetical protein [Erwinia phage vB_Ea277G]|nr:hypothetical protein [Erwinia phage vB_Ea277G]
MKEPSSSGVQIFECMRAFELLDDVVEMAPMGCHINYDLWLGGALRQALTNQGGEWETACTWCSSDRGEQEWYRTVLYDAQVRIIDMFRKQWDEVAADDARNVLVVTDWKFLFKAQTIVVRYVRR